MLKYKSRVLMRSNLRGVTSCSKSKKKYCM